MNRREFLKGVVAVSIIASVPVWVKPMVDLSYPPGDVRRYGARTDSPDNTHAFQAAIDDVGSAYIPPGTWRIGPI